MCVCVHAERVVDKKKHEAKNEEPFQQIAFSLVWTQEKDDIFYARFAQFQPVKYLRASHKTSSSSS